MQQLDRLHVSCYVCTQDDVTSTWGRWKRHADLHDVTALYNKPPRWNDQLNAYCLNFSGRVTHASVKNFQLVGTDDSDRVVLQFGKVWLIEGKRRDKRPAHCVCCCAAGGRVSLERPG